MLIFTRQALAFIAVPKTGTTAIESALKKDADILHRKGLKHTSAQRFHRKIRPFIQDNFGVDPEVFAVMREPEDQIRSWYKYRSRVSLILKPEYCGHVSFDEFVEATLLPDPPPFAQIGSQFRMLSGGRSRVLVDHLFAYERSDLLSAFLSERFAREVTFPSKNVSPEVPAELSPQVRAKLRAAREEEFELYGRLMDSGGKLEPRTR